MKCALSSWCKPLIPFTSYRWYYLLIYNILFFYTCSDRNGGNGADFAAGFLLGGAVFGTLAYIFAPQVSIIFFRPEVLFH